MERGLPSLQELGSDLLHVSSGRLAFALAAPFAFSTAFFVFARGGHFLLALAAVAALSFITYGSTSHDLVHGNFHLPRGATDALLAAIELLALRSGHAYRISHLAHHRCFPGDGDAEGRPAHWGLLRVLLAGPVYVPWLWGWAWRRAGKGDRAWIALETAAVLAFAGAAVALRSPSMLAYCALVFAATWIFPLGLVYWQHDASGADDLHRTRRYRGRVIPALLLQHLYHLEHHLYPAVPANGWHELSRRLDPHLDRLGVKAIPLP
ncbi:MAG: fatty acid desaturase [Myxococcales bacterium]